MVSPLALTAAVLLAASTPQPKMAPEKGTPLSAPEPESLDRGAVAAWMAKYVRADDWTLLAYDTEGVKLTAPGGVKATPDGFAETDVRTELFHPVELSVGVARSGVARWNVDCEHGLLAVLSMTVYAGNNLQGELARKTTEGQAWQSPIGSQFESIRKVCKAIGREAKLEPMAAPN